MTIKKEGLPSTTGVSRRQFLKATGLAAGALALAACAPGQPGAATGGAATAPTKIDVWFPFPLTPEPGEKIHPFAQMLKDFNEKGNTGVTANVLTTNWNMEKLITAIAGGTPPDSFYMDRYIGNEWGARKLLTALDPYFDASSKIKKEDIWPELLKDVTWKGTTFGAPMYTDVRAFYWNKDIFSDAGLDPEKQPTTWAELEDYTKKILKTDANGDIERLGYTPSIGNPPVFLVWYIHLWQLGGEFMNAEGTKVTFNNEAGVKAMDFLLQCFEWQGGIEKVEKFASALTPGPGQDVFMIGKMGMQINGDWVPPNFDTYAPDLKWGIGHIPIPEGGQQSNYHGGHAWIIPKGAKQPDASWKLVEYALSEDTQLNVSLSANVIPAREKLAESDPYLSGEPKNRSDLRKLFVEEFKHAKWVPTIPGVGEIIGINLQYVDECLRKVKTPEQAVQAFADGVQKIMDDWQAKLAS